jgi:hypothetical protein
VHQAQQAGRDVKVAAQEIIQNKRLLSGVVIVLLSPFSLMAYKLFDSTVDDRSWYFTSMYWYMWSVGPYICCLFWSVGVFLLFPTKSSFRYVAIIPGISFSATQIIHCTFFVHDHTSYHNHSLGEITFGVGMALSILLCVDYVLYRKYHLKDGNTARIKGIIKAPGIDANTKVTILESLVEESENLYARV